MVIDTGIVALKHQTLSAIRNTVDLSSVEFIYLTHTDADHVGCVWELLDEAPQAKLVTTFLGMGKLGLSRAVPPHRVLLANPGETIDLGDRRVVVGKPPVFDAPETTWLHEPDADVLFSSDCFGAVLSRPYDSASRVPEKELQGGLVAWTGIDAPWFVDQKKDRVRENIEAITPPTTLLSAHLPPAQGISSTLLDYLSSASDTAPPPMPDQTALEAMLKSA
jgi:glyoxylase-like metal-dependent hydrolase (beta-lactamase superfamily II)